MTEYNSLTNGSYNKNPKDIKNKLFFGALILIIGFLIYVIISYTLQQPKVIDVPVVDIEKKLDKLSNEVKEVNKKNDVIVKKIDSIDINVENKENKITNIYTDIKQEQKQLYDESDSANLLFFKSYIHMYANGERSK